MGLVAINVCIRGDFACLTASQARSMSAIFALDKPAIVEFLMFLLISDTASKSPFDAIGNLLQ